MPKLVIVHRYENPDRYGLHVNDRDENIFDTLGLFDERGLAQRLDTHAPLEPSFVSFKQLIDCAPVEWHRAMRDGQLLDRFMVLTTTDSQGNTRE